MKNLKFLCILIMLGLSASSFSQTIDANAWDGKIYFKVKNSSMTELQDFHSGHVYSDPFLSTLITKYTITEIFKPFPRLYSQELQKTYQINFLKKDSVLMLIADLEAADYIEYAEKIPIERITAIPPADPLYTAGQWSLNQINAVGAWNIHPAAASTGYFNNNVIVAVVDNEVLTTHQDLINNLWVNPGELGADEDGNGYIGDFNGWDAGDNDGNPNPPNPTFDHGTHVSGIAVGETDNGLGIASLSWNVRLMAIKGTSDFTSPSILTNPWGGVSYAIENGADIINMSWGGPGSSVTCQNIINYGTSLGIIFVAAAGNSNVDLAATPFFPAMYNNVITVGSTGTTVNFDEKSTFSNYGVGIDVMAPGWDIMSSVSAGTSSYGLKSGTSMACPLVASLCALMKSYNPNLTAAQITNCITTTCDNISTIASNGSYPGQLGAGRINAQAALQCLLTVPNVAFSSNASSLCPGQNISFFDNSTGATATSWNWTFPGGTPGASTLQNPVITYNTPGIYNVTLSVTNSLGTSVQTINNYVVVNGSCSITNLTQGNWYFGRRAGVNFSTGVPVAVNAAVVNSTINSDESAVSISDPVTGALLFYTDANNVWDGNHVLITAGLIGSTSRSQILAVPNPANANQYILFHSPDISSVGPNFLYSIVDVTGGVVTVPVMNSIIPLPPGATTISEQITAVPHCNGRDFWIIVHGMNRANSTVAENSRMYVYLLSPFGLTNKIMSAATPDVYIITHRANIGQLKASPDGTKLGIASWGASMGVALYDFNNSTGIISNEQILDPGTTSFYGCAFDPSSSFLYATTFGTNSILAWDLGNLSGGSSTITTASASAGGLQLGPDGIIYAARNSGVRFLGAINPPYSTTSAYVATAVDLQSCTGCFAAAVTSRLSLPNFVEVPQPPPTAPSFTYFVNANCTTVDFNSSCYGNYTATWNFGDLSPTVTGPVVSHNYTATGTYTVTLTLSNAAENFVVNQTITIINPTSTLVISGPSPTCFDNTSPDDYSITPISGATYNWTVTNGMIVSPDPSNSNLISINWTSAGTATISVSVTIGACTSSVSIINVMVNPLPVITVVPSTTTICTGASSTLTASGASTYSWSPATGLSCSTCANTIANPTATTTYTVTGTDANGCINTASVTIIVNPTPAPTVSVNSSTLCAGQMTFLTATVSPGGGTYSWAPSTGLGCTTCPNTTSSPATTTSYTVTYTVGGCSNSAISTVTVNPNPVITISASSTSAPSTLTPSGGTSYTWAPAAGLSCTSCGVTVASPTVTTTYTVTGTNAFGCTGTATVTITPSVTVCTSCTALPATITGLQTPGQVYCINSPMTISGTGATFALSEIKIAPTVTITVNPGATLTISGCHFYACDKMWQGIVVKPGGKIIVQNFILGPWINRSSLIEDARVAIEIQAGSALTSGILSVTNTTFNRNEVGIRFDGYTLPVPTYPFLIQSSIFTCRDIPFTPNSLVWPQTNTVRTAPTPASPLQTPYINSSTYSETNPAAYLKPPFTTSLPGVKSFIAIDLSQVGNVVFTGPTPSIWYDIRIGNNGPPNLNVFDNHTICINAFNSNFTSVNNVFQKTINTSSVAGTAILANAKDQNFRAQVIPGISTGAFNNRFYDCTYSIVTNNYFENTFTFCDVRSTQAGALHFFPPPHALPLLNHRGQFGFFVTTDRFRIVNMSDNKMYNLENAIKFVATFGAYNIGGVVFSPPGGGQYSGQVDVNRNEIAPQVPTFLWATQYVRSAIVLDNVIASGLQAIPGNTVNVNNNTLTNVHNGILIRNWQRKNIINNSNTIILARDLFTTIVTQYGIEHDVNMAATPFGNSINANTVMGTGFITNQSIYGIITTKCIDEHVVCNLTDGTTHGIEFAGGHINVKFDNNSMTNNYYGYVLSNNGIIGVQGDPSHPRDNVWLGTWTVPHYKTATLGSSSLNSKMYVRTNSVSNYNPDPSGTTTLTANQDEYLFANTLTSLVVSATPVAATGCAVICCGGSGGSPGAAAITLMENIAQDNIPFLNNPDQTKYINKNQLYRLLKADASLRSASAVLQNFYNTSISTTRETLSSIEDDLASSDLLTAQGKTDGIVASNVIEENYKTFFNIYLKYQADTILPSDSLALFSIAAGCPFTDGDVVFQARALYNSIYKTNIYFENNCPEIPQRNYSALKDKTEPSFDVLVYPNPNTGIFSLIPFSADITELNVKAMDVNGKIVFNKKISSGDRLFDLNLDVPDGIYMIIISNPQTNENIVKRIVIQK
jgi:subtilisin family serine protease